MLPKLHKRVIHSVDKAPSNLPDLPDSSHKLGQSYKQHLLHNGNRTESRCCVRIGSALVPDHFVQQLCDGYFQ